MRMKMSETVELDAVETIAAKTVATRCLKIVDASGRVRIEANTESDTNDSGPHLILRGSNGREALALRVSDGFDGDPDYIEVWILGEKDQHISLFVGGMKGPGLALNGPRRRGKDGVHDELLSGPTSGFVAVHGKKKSSTIMQLTLGEDVETFVEEGDSEPAAS